MSFEFDFDGYREPPDRPIEAEELGDNGHGYAIRFTFGEVPRVPEIIVHPEVVARAVAASVERLKSCALEPQPV